LRDAMRLSLLARSCHCATPAGVSLECEIADPL
jgi:hypothetical protein